MRLSRTSPSYGSYRITYFLRITKPSLPFPANRGPPPWWLGLISRYGHQFFLPFPFRVLLTCGVRGYTFVEADRRSFYELGRAGQPCAESLSILSTRIRGCFRPAPATSVQGACASPWILLVSWHDVLRAEASSVLLLWQPGK